MKNLEISIENYKKSNDEKYLTEIKNTTGSSLGDESLQNLASKKKTDFINELKDLFIEKQKSRIEILGKEQNSSSGKKIFLQIIDFSWRSHLQYLEQLRQVIGLTQYGQRDPLIEFKRRLLFSLKACLLKLKMMLLNCY